MRGLNLWSIVVGGLRFLLFIFAIFYFWQTLSVQEREYLDSKSDLIIFSYDRPMQLYALLESMEKHLKGIGEVVVIYRISSDRYINGYQVLQSDFPSVRFICQKNAPADFKTILMQELASGKAPFVCFAVDDMIVKNPADLSICTRLMDEFSAYAFFLRLGTHINAFYPSGSGHAVPTLREIAADILQWNFNDKDAIDDWSYPHNVDMTIYRRSDVQKNLHLIEFRNPNTMEARWAAQVANIVAYEKGLCYRDSIVINIPVNQVQTEWEMPCMHSWSPAALLELFETGMKIDISVFSGIKNNMCHMNYDLQFIMNPKIQTAGGLRGAK